MFGDFPARHVRLPKGILWSSVDVGIIRANKPASWGCSIHNRGVKPWINTQWFDRRPIGTLLFTATSLKVNGCPPKSGYLIMFWSHISPFFIWNLAVVDVFLVITKEIRYWTPHSWFASQFLPTHGQNIWCLRQGPWAVFVVATRLFQGSVKPWDMAMTDGSRKHDEYLLLYFQVSAGLYAQTVITLNKPQSR